MTTRVVHLKRDPYDVRIDRQSIFGNPWTHKQNTKAQFIVRSRAEAIACYRDWLLGIRFQEVLQRQRRLILEALPSLRNKTLGCWCKPKGCHGEVLIELLEMRQPALQVISVARKPISESTVADNVIKWGTGGLNIDGSRVGTSDNLNGGAYAVNPTPRGGRDLWTAQRKGDTQCFKRGGAGDYEQPSGRWPANLILTHKSGCRIKGTKQVGNGDLVIGGPPRSKSAHIQQMSEQPRTEAIMSYGTETIDDWECVDNCAAADLGGHQSWSGGNTGNAKTAGITSLFGSGGGKDPDGSKVPHGWGSVGRFFKQFKRTDDMSIRPPQELIEYLKTMISPPTGEVLIALDLPAVRWDQYADNQMQGIIIAGDPKPYLDEIWRIMCSGAFLLSIAPTDHPVGYRSTCAIEDRGFEIRDAICLVREPGALHYVPKASSSERNAGLEGDRNNHPTVKPIDLFKKLLNKVPPDQTVVDPFAGSGTTAVAAIQTGHSVTLIDREKEYCEIATARVQHWDSEHAGWRGAEIESDTPLEKEQEPMGLDDLFGFGDE